MHLMVEMDESDILISESGTEVPPQGTNHLKIQYPCGEISGPLNQWNVSI